MTKSLKSWLPTVAAGVVGLSAAGCNNGSPGGRAADPAAPAPAEVGALLYPALPMPALPASSPVAEPIVMPSAVVQYDMRTQIPAAVDGVVELIATPLPDGAKFNPSNDPEIVYHPRDVDKKQPYRRLRENDLITKGQILARLDDQVIYMQKMMHFNSMPVIKKALNASEDAARLQKELLDQMEPLMLKGSLSKSEFTPAAVALGAVRRERDELVQGTHQDRGRVQVHRDAAQALLGHQRAERPRRAAHEESAGLRQGRRDDPRTAVHRPRQGRGQAGRRVRLATA